MYKAIFDNAVDGILILENNVFIKCNKSALDIFNYTQEKQILGKRPEDISPEYQPDGQLSKDKAMDVIKKSIKNNGAKFEWVHNKSNGEEFWLEIVLTPIIHEDKNLVHVVLRDIQERKIEQKKLEYLNKNLKKEIEIQIEEIRQKEAMLLEKAKLASIGEMIENIAHQWRQPLNNLALVNQDIYVNLLLGKNDIKKFEKSQTIINENIQFMSKTIDEFRDFFNPNKEKTIFEIRTAVENTLRIVKATYKSNFINIKVKYDSKTTLNNYLGELEQVLIIVLQNAKDILIEKKVCEPSVCIKTKETKENVLLTIEDNAGGVPADIISKIFEPYFTTKFKSNGTGIGLYTAKIIIEKNMGGKLSVKNTKNGAKFEISIPKISALF